MYNYEDTDDPRGDSPETADAAGVSMQSVSLEHFQTGPGIIYGLIAITVAVFALQTASDYFLGYDLPAALGMKVNDLIAAGQYWRLITPVFLHGSFLHIGFNMYALWVLGPGLLRFYGNARFLALYFLAAFAGNVASMVFTPQPSLGASTAIFGVFAAQGVFLYLNRRIFDPQRTQRALREILILVAINFVIGLAPGIDMWGHMGGALGGLIFAWFGGPLLAVQLENLLPTLVDLRTRSQWLWAAVGDALAFAVLAVLWLNYFGP